MLTVTLMMAAGIALVSQIDKSDMEPGPNPKRHPINNSTTRGVVITALRLFLK